MQGWFWVEGFRNIVSPSWIPAHSFRSMVSEASLPKHSFRSMAAETWSPKHSFESIVSEAGANCYAHSFLTNRSYIFIVGTSAKLPSPSTTPFQAKPSLHLETSSPEETQQDDKAVHILFYCYELLSPINMGPWFNLPWICVYIYIHACVEWPTLQRASN